jgi:hypothetical protein
MCWHLLIALGVLRNIGVVSKQLLPIQFKFPGMYKSSTLWGLRICGGHFKELELAI